MPPTTPPATPSGAAPTPPKAPEKKTGSWIVINRRANSVANVIALLVAVLVLGGAVGFVVELYRHPATTSKPTVETLSPDDIRKLTDIGTSLGNSNQVLNIGANSVFHSNVDVGGDLSVGGHFNANGPVTLSQLNITGTTALTGLNVGSNLIVGGDTTLQKSLTVAQLATLNGGLTVNGSATIKSLNAGSIAVQSISIAGPLTIGHLITQGVTPTASAGTAVGPGGTVSISGDDTAGTVNINSSSSPTTGILMTVVFRAAYSSTARVIISPITAAAASTPTYVTRTATGFQLHSDVSTPASSTLSFDYIVVQ